jgi:uncharacterized protein (DUF1501 family)
MIDRRRILGGAAMAGAAAAWPRIAFADGPTDKRLVIVLLRGAMDGLTAAPAYGDPNYERARAGIATPAPGTPGGALALDCTFGLHPALAHLHARYAKKELIVFHAIASPYRDRSHFDGQNVLENGSGAPYGLADGWLNRSLLGLPETLRSGRSDPGIALAPVMPLMMRGPARVTSWSPSILPGPNADLVARIKRLYDQTDPKLSMALAGAADANAAAAGGPGGGGEAVVGLMTAAARFMAEPNGPCAAMVESTGWDTHANQVGAYGALPRNLATLDKGIEALATGLGPKWSATAVVVMTEFGRTVAMNGTGGTDHGTGGAAFLVGGAVKGGRVAADWPGLQPANLYEGRDLRPTADLRSVLKAALGEHMGVEPGFIDRTVFPASGEAQPMQGLFQA